MSLQDNEQSVRYSPRPIELLAPAKNIETAICAITHGADAVYIGSEGFGARSAATNSTEDIKRLCDFAHPFRAKVYATVNTLVLEKELKQVEKLINDLYYAGVDALIVQDMGILRLDIPPIALHASTQCDTRTPEKALFLQEAGFSQIVLARELTLNQISDICDNLSVPVETFIHGALCVSYSGRCNASYSLCGRSANRGRCAQICRLPFILKDASGRVLNSPSHLLSLKDFNASDLLSRLLSVGVSSFKIEGRLKDMNYVKNITSYYRQLIDKEIYAHPDKYVKSSYGNIEFNFEPNPSKSFNRGFTHYFLENRQPESIASMRTPKSLGEVLEPDAELHAGDGISFFNPSGEYTGARVNKIVCGKPVFAKKVNIPQCAKLYRTTDSEFEKVLERTDTAVRKIAVEIKLYENRIEAADERGCRVLLPVPAHNQDARKPMEPIRFFDKLGNTTYTLRSFENILNSSSFIPASQLTALRRALIDALDRNARIIYQRPLRMSENRRFPYPQKSLVYSDNVANSYAERFYREHGVKEIEYALETLEDFKTVVDGAAVMTTRHCILRELGMCKRSLKAGNQKPLKEPLVLENPAGANFTLRFNCKDCEMQLLKRK